MYFVLYWLDYYCFRIEEKMGRDFQAHCCVPSFCLKSKKSGHTGFWNGSNYKYQLSKVAFGLDETYLNPSLVLVWDGTFDFERPNKPVEWFAHFGHDQQIEFAESWAVRIWVYMKNGILPAFHGKTIRDGDISWTMTSRGHFFSKWGTSCGHCQRVTSRGHFLVTSCGSFLRWIFVDIFWVNSSGHFLMVIINSANCRKWGIG